MNTVNGFPKPNIPHAKINSFLKREKGLKKKAYELATLCGVEVCLICFGPNGDRPGTWPENSSKFLSVIKRYTNLSDKDKQLKSTDLSTYTKPNIDRLKVVLEVKRKENRELVYPSWVDQLNNYSEESLRDLIVFLDSYLKTLKLRSKKKEPKDEISGEADGISGGDVKMEISKGGSFESCMARKLAEKIEELTPETFEKNKDGITYALDLLQHGGVSVNAMRSRIDSLGEMLRTRTTRQEQIVETRRNLERMKQQVIRGEAEVAELERLAKVGFYDDFVAEARKPL